MFLLTDGDVGNPDSVISIVKKHNKTCRTFTIGVGNGASPYLVKQIAKAGRGKAEMIVESSKITEKVMFLLQSSISPVLDDFKFQLDEHVEMMTPGPSSSLTVLKNEPIKMFLFMKPSFNQANSTKIKMTYFDSTKNATVSTELDIKKDDAHRIGNVVH